MVNLKVKIILFFLLSAFAASAAELPLSGYGQSLQADVLPYATLRGSAGQKSADAAGHQQLASTMSERSLSQALELPPSEHFSLEESIPLETDDFELRLPEQDLPESDFPLTFNDKVEYFTRSFQTTGRQSFSKWLSRSERYIPMMREVLKKEGLPEDLVYLAMIESGFSPHAYSVASAVGPWQFMSATGKRYSLRIDPWIDERRDPLKSTVAAALYLKELYAMFNNDWYLAAAGYNAGENKIMRAISMYNSRDFWQISKGEYLKRETKDYVPKLLAAAIIAKEPAKYGFADVAYLPAIEFDTVKIPSKTDLELVARICNTECKNIRDLNPELRRLSTPPDYSDYELKIPKGQKAHFEAEYAKISEDKRSTEEIRHVHYRAKKKDTLASIAKRFNTTTQVIAELNNLGKSKHLRGKKLLVPVQIATHSPVAGSHETNPENKNSFNKYYIVKKGDTLRALAKRFNVSTTLLSLWNNLKTRVALRPGKRIIVAIFVEKKGQMVSASEDNG